MKAFSTLLLPLDGSATAAKSVGCTVWLAKRLDARLHILSATEDELPAQQALQRLRVPEEHWPLITLHQATEFPEKALLDAVRDVDAELVVMSARGQAADLGGEDADPLKRLGHVTQWVVERAEVPVLVLPPAYQERLPWTTALVPISGEVEADEALTVAVHLAETAGFCIEVAHVVGAGQVDTGLMAEARYADAPHHEFPDRLQTLISRALPGFGRGQCPSIKDVYLLRGDPGDELSRVIAEHAISLLVVGWHGRFIKGHANVVKRLFDEMTCPVVLVKAGAPAPFKLKVGDEFE